MVMKATSSRRGVLLSALLLVRGQTSAERLQGTPRSSWPGPAVLACIQTKEAGLRELSSEPQAFFGNRMKDLPLPVKR